MQLVRRIVGLFSFVLITTTLWGGEGLEFVESKISEFNRLRTRLAENNTETVRTEITKKGKEIALNTLDLQDIARLSLGNYYGQITEQQKKEYKNLFHDLIATKVVAANIPEKPKLKKELPLKLKSEKDIRDRRFERDAIVVYGEVKGKRLTYDVDLYLHKTNKGLKLYDVVLDGDSTLLLYRNQFASILRKHKTVKAGMDDIISRLKNRINELEKKQ